MAIIGQRTLGIGDVDASTCGAVQCGAGDPSLGLQCSMAGFVGNHTCGDPMCAPFKAEMEARGICPNRPVVVSNAPVNNNPVQFPMREEVQSTLGPVVQSPKPNIVSAPPKPQIVNSAKATGGDCGDFSKWVNENKGLTAAGLLLLAFFISGDGPGGGK